MTVEKVPTEAPDATESAATTPETQPAPPSTNGRQAPTGLPHMADGAEHRNVTEALAAVMHDLPGIGKDGRADASMGGYSFRGIEHITAHAQEALARHGVVPYPRVIGDPTITPISVNGKPWSDTMMKVEYRFKHGPSDTEELVGPLIAIGRDNSDKGPNKCMTQAFKYALIQVLCIGDKADDADQGSPEADARGTADPYDQREWWETAGYADQTHLDDTTATLKMLVDAVAGPDRGPIRDWLKENGYGAYLPVRQEHVESYTKVLTAAAAATEAGEKARQREAAKVVDVRPDGTAPTAEEATAAPRLPEPEQTPTEAQPEPEPAASPETAAEAAQEPEEAAAETDRIVDETVAKIKTMTEAELDAALVRRGTKIDPEWDVVTRQKLLAGKMVTEAAEKRARAAEEF